MAKKLVRMSMKLLRISLFLTQEEMAKNMGYCVTQYLRVENAERDGTLKFWRTYQKTFAIPDADMWRYMNDIQEEPKK